MPSLAPILSLDEVVKIRDRLDRIADLPCFMAQAFPVSLYYRFGVR